MIITKNVSANTLKEKIYVPLEDLREEMFFFVSTIDHIKSPGYMTWLTNRKEKAPFDSKQEIWTDPLDWKIK